MDPELKSTVEALISTGEPAPEDSSSFEYTPIQKDPGYYFFRRIYLCGHPEEIICVEKTTPNRVTHTIVPWVPTKGNKAEPLMHFTLERCAQCATEYVTQPALKTVTNQGITRRRRGNKRDGFLQALNRCKYGVTYASGEAVVHSSSDEEDAGGNIVWRKDRVESYERPATKYSTYATLRERWDAEREQQQLEELRRLSTTGPAAVEDAETATHTADRASQGTTRSSVSESIRFAEGYAGVAQTGVRYSAGTTSSGGQSSTHGAGWEGGSVRGHLFGRTASTRSHTGKGGMRGLVARIGGRRSAELPERAGVRDTAITSWSAEAKLMWTSGEQRLGVQQGAGVQRSVTMPVDRGEAVWKTERAITKEDLMTPLPTFPPPKKKGFGDWTRTKGWNKS